MRQDGGCFEEESYGYGTLLFLRIMETIIHKEQRFVFTGRAVGVSLNGSVVFPGLDKNGLFGTLLRIKHIRVRHVLFIRNDLGSLDTVEVRRVQDRLSRDTVPLSS